MNQLAAYYDAGRRDAAEGKPARPVSKGEKRMLRRAYLTGYRNERGRVRRTRRYSQLHLGLAALALVSLCAIVTPAEASRRSPATRATPTPPATTIRLRWTMPDSVEWRRPGWSRPDSVAPAHSDMRGEVWFVPRFGPPYWPPPQPLPELLLCVTGWRWHGSAVDTIISTPGHGALFVRARNAAGAWIEIRSRLTAARTSE